MIAALQAVRPQENYCKLSEPGTIQVGDDGKTKFAAFAERQAPVSDFRSGTERQGHSGLYELASTKQVPRAPRFRPQQKKQ